MYKGASITVLDESEGTGDRADNNHMDVMELNLDISGELLHIRIGVKDQPAKLADMVPLARSLSAKIISLVKQHNSDNGHTIPCFAGCSQYCAIWFLSQFLRHCA
ncbi:MAG: hypothetical protein ISS70_03330 [Phycisphaerae bacterium]|nr:hypothetical protein [Phycisphaerae bacterium]